MRKCRGPNLPLAFEVAEIFAGNPPWNVSLIVCRHCKDFEPMGLECYVVHFDHAPHHSSYICAKTFQRPERCPYHLEQTVAAQRSAEAVAALTAMNRARLDNERKALARLKKMRGE